MKKQKLKKKFILTVAIPTRNYLFGVNNIFNELVKKKIEGVQYVFYENSTNNEIYNYLFSRKNELNFKVIRSDNLGFIDHWNKILKNTDTDYLLMLHHDELINCDDIYYLIKQIRNSNTDFFIFKIKKISSDKIWNVGFSKIIIAIFIRYLRPLILYINFIGPMSAMCFRNNKDFLFHTEVKYYVDMDIFYQIFLKYKNNFKVLSKSIYSDTLNEKSITNDLSSISNKLMQNERIFFKKKYFINKYLDKVLYYLAFQLRIVNFLIGKLNQFIFFKKK